MHLQILFLQIDDGEHDSGNDENDEEQHQGGSHSQHYTRIDFGFEYRILAQASVKIFRTFADHFVAVAELTGAAIFAFTLVWLGKWMLERGITLAIHTETGGLAIGTRTTEAMRNEQTLMATVI